ncbi:MAG: glycosyltransferase, partial [Bacteroidota bacterium]
MRIHVLFLSSWFPSKVHSTLGNFVLNHAEAAAKECDVSILYLAKQTAINNIQLDEEIIDGIRIVRVYYPKNGFFFRTRFKAFKVGYRHLFANKNLPNIIQMNMIWPEGWQAWFLKKKFKIPYCISDNWTGYHADQRAPLSFFQKKYMQFIANNSSKLIPVTSHLESAMRHINFKVESEIIPNVINLNIFTSERKADSNTIQFLHVSHLDDNHKNISGILRVWKEIAKEHSNVHLKIGGDGPVEKWKSFARQLEIPPRSISFFGTSSSKEIASIMHSSHAFVLFSN